MTKQELIQFICDMFNVSECTEMILRQIHKYVTERRYDYLEIARALSYYVDVQGESLQIKYGIGIVPFVMDAARKYYKQQEEQKVQQLRAAKKAKQNQPQQQIHVKVSNKNTIKKPYIDMNKL